MRRLVFYGLVILVIYYLLRGHKPHSKRGRKTKDESSLKGVDLVQDPQCGVYVPKTTAIRGRNGMFYCSKECRDAHRKKQSGKP